MAVLPPEASFAEVVAYTRGLRGDVDDAEERWFDDEGIVESTDDDGLP